MPYSHCNKQLTKSFSDSDTADDLYRWYDDEPTAELLDHLVEVNGLAIDLCGDGW